VSFAANRAQTTRSASATPENTVVPEACFGACDSAGTALNELDRLLSPADLEDRFVAGRVSLRAPPHGA
jgi:hypothetical protein